MKNQKLHFSMKFHFIDSPIGRDALLPEFDGIDIMRVRDQQTYYCPDTDSTFNFGIDWKNSILNVDLYTEVIIPDDVEEDVQSSYIISRIKFDIQQDMEYEIVDITAEWLDNNRNSTGAAIVYKMHECLDKDVW